MQQELREAEAIRQEAITARNEARKELKIQAEKEAKDRKERKKERTEKNKEAQEMHKLWLEEEAYVALSVCSPFSYPIPPPISNIFVIHADEKRARHARGSKHIHNSRNGIREGT